MKKIQEADELCGDAVAHGTLNEVHKQHLVNVRSDGALPGVT
jgi:hypothetical protein